MEQLDSHIFNAITKLRNNKKQPNGNFIYSYILKAVESLISKLFDGRLHDMINTNKFKNNHIVEETNALL